MLRSRPLVSALLGILLAGCAGHGPPRLAERDRARLGTIAVIAAEVPPEWSFTYPVPSGSGAAFAGIGAGLGTGVLSGALCMVSFGRVVEACGLAIWTPVMMVSGGIEGGRKGVPLAEFAAAAGALALVAGESQVQEALRDQIVRCCLRGRSRARSRRGPAAVPSARRSAGTIERWPPREWTPSWRCTCSTCGWHGRSGPAPSPPREPVVRGHHQSHARASSARAAAGHPYLGWGRDPHPHVRASRARR
jgi:hypothetical protein